MEREYLLFRLWGPLASWGGVAVGEVRGSAIVPSRSALLGLLAGALGLERDDESSHVELGRTLRFAVLVEAAGAPLTDYHTAQLAPPRRGRTDRNRADELRGPRHELRTILSRREYRCDALYRVAAWQEAQAGEAPRWSLVEIEQALDRPVFVPYLGRKACPLGLPLGARRVTAETLPRALESPDPPEVSTFIRSLVRSWRLRDATARLYWEGEPEMGDLGEVVTTVRRDDPRSRIRWTFGTRDEHSATWPEGSGSSQGRQAARSEERESDVPE